MYTITYINSKKKCQLTSNELDNRLNSVQTAHRSTQPSSHYGPRSVLSLTECTVIGLYPLRIVLQFSY